LVSRVTVEALMPILSDFEPRQLNRRLSNLHVEFVGENGSDWSGHCCDRTRVFGKNSGRGEAWYVRDDVTRREFRRGYVARPKAGSMLIRRINQRSSMPICGRPPNGRDFHR
jgi:hypothetical protein